MVVSKFVWVFIFILIHGYQALKIIPERTIVNKVNEKYFYNSSVTVRRSNKRGDYVINILSHTKCALGNNVTVNIILYEYRSNYNQYVRSYLEFHFKLCDLILKDPLLGHVLRSRGTTQCPIPAGRYELANATFQAEIGFDWPFEKGKAEVILTKEPGGEIIFSSETILLFLQTKSKIKKNH